MTLHVNTRILLPVWGHALADGEKPYELQRYKMHNMNQMRFAEVEGDKVLIVGITGSSEIVAVCHVAAAERDVGPSRVDQLKTSLRDLSMQTSLSEYIRGGKSFDVLYFDIVHDVRPLHLTWKDLEAKLGCRISRNSGFPKVPLPSHGGKVLEELLQQTCVIKHVFEWPGLKEDEVEQEGASTSTSDTDTEDSGSEPSAKRQRLWNHHE